MKRLKVERLKVKKVEGDGEVAVGGSSNSSEEQGRGDDGDGEVVDGGSVGEGAARSRSQPRLAAR